MVVAAAISSAFAMRQGGAGTATAGDEAAFPPVSVAVYDFDATSLQPDATSSGAVERADYASLYAAAPGFFDAALNDDPKRVRLQLFDVSFPQGVKSIQPGPSFHPTFISEGAAPPTDYAVTGTVSGTRGAYTLKVSVQDAKTHDEVAATTATFANPGDAAAAGKQAEAQLAPLVDKIDAFRRLKRDAGGDTTAIDAQLTVTPAKTAIGIGEAIPVKLVLADRDGVRLKNRKLTLSTDGPLSVSPAEVTTNDQGEAQATATGAGHAGPATILARYSYTDVTHREVSAGNDWASIQVGKPDGDVWEVRVDMTEHAEETYRAEASDSKETTITTTDTKIGMVGWISARAGASVGSVESQNLIAQSGGGDYAQTYTEMGRTIDTGNGDLVRTSKDFTSILGHFAPGKMTSESMSFIINPPYKGNPQYKIKPAPGSFLVAINGLPSDASRRGHSVKEYYGKNPRPPAVLDQNDTQSVRTGLFSASAETTPPMQKTGRYTIVKKFRSAPKPGSTDAATYTVTLRPLTVARPVFSRPLK